MCYVFHRRGRGGGSVVVGRLKHEFLARKSGKRIYWDDEHFLVDLFPGMATTESKDEYRPSYMDHFDKMFESPQTANHVKERKSSDSSNSSQVVMRRTESPFSPPKKFGPGDFDFVSVVVIIFLNTR